MFGLDGRLAGQGGFHLDRLQAWTRPFHLGADLVHHDQLLGRQQAVRYHAAIDQLGPRVVRRWNQVAPAEPGASQRDLLRAFREIVAVNGQEIRRIAMRGIGKLLGVGRKKLLAYGHAGTAGDRHRR